jgi:uncharacterized membrane protein
MFSNLRKYVIAGLLVWVPLGITILVIKLLIDLLDRTMILLPPPLRPETLLGFSIPGLGILISAIVILGTGFLIIRYAGQRFVHWTEKVVGRIPLVRSIYSATKQVTETILTSDKNAFREVYLLEYPRKGIWSIGFQTGEGIEQAREHIRDNDLLTLFVPTTPNPTSGFIMMVPKKDAKKLDIDVESALKLIVSLGVVTPPTKNTVTSMENLTSALPSDKEIAAPDDKH